MCLSRSQGIRARDASRERLGINEDAGVDAGARVVFKAFVVRTAEIRCGTCRNMTGG